MNAFEGVDIDGRLRAGEGGNRNNSRIAGWQNSVLVATFKTESPRGIMARIERRWFLPSGKLKHYSTE